MSEPSSTARNVRHEILFAFALALACYLAWLLRDVLLLLYACALFAVVFAPLVRSTSMLHVGRRQPFKGSAILILLLGAAAAIAAFGFLALPPVIADLQAFAQQMPSRLPALLLKLKSIPLAQHLDNADFISQLQAVASHAAAYLFSSVRDWAGVLFDAVMGLILTIYFILDGDRAYRWFLSFFPRENRDQLDKTLQRARIRLGGWLLGQ
ncbi:MAG: AI-2E family transporter, partial [Terracidiphilus sp.]